MSTTRRAPTRKRLLPRCGARDGALDPRVDKSSYWDVLRLLGIGVPPRQLVTLSALATAVSACLLACSSTPPPAIVKTPDAGNESGTQGGSYTLKQLGCGAAGTQSVAAVSGSTVAFVSLSETTKKQTCTIMPLGPVVTSK